MDIIKIKIFASLAPRHAYAALAEKIVPNARRGPTSIWLEISALTAYSRRIWNNVSMENNSGGA